MWLSRRTEAGRRREAAVQVGSVTLPGDPAGAVLDGERRDMPVYGPGGCVWRPAQGQEVLVVKAGTDGEQPCVAGVRCRADWNLAPGELLLYSGGASVYLSNSGVIAMSGDVRVNGKRVVVEEE